jgi:predicted ester cyclase
MRPCDSTRFEYKEVEDMAADSDHIAVRWHAHGTHLGTGLGVPATGRPVAFRGVTWITFKNRRHRRGLEFVEPGPAPRVA